MTADEVRYWTAYGKGCTDTESSLTALRELEDHDLRAQVDRLQALVIDLLDDDQAIREAATETACGLGAPRPLPDPLPGLSDEHRAERTAQTIGVVQARREILARIPHSWSDGKDHGPEYLHDDEQAHQLYAVARQPIPGSGEAL